MIEWLGFLYGLAKDIKSYLTWGEETKLVDREWLKKSGFEDLMNNKGYKLRWTTPEKIETRKLDGYEIIYEIDKSKCVRRRIVRGREPLTLLGKKESS
jgi:hypothetical protein